MDEVIVLTLHFFCLLGLGCLLVFINKYTYTNLWAKRITWWILWCVIFVLVFENVRLAYFVNRVVW